MLKARQGVADQLGSAYGADGEVDLREVEEEIHPCGGLYPRTDGVVSVGRRDREKLAGDIELGCCVARGHESVVSDLDEA